MAENADIVRIATDVVSANTAPKGVSSVTATSSSSSTGEDILRIVVVLAPEAAGKLQGDAPLNILVQLQDRLQQVGETRFPIVDYATPDELTAASGDR
jgi:hypothetical protein